MVEPAGYTGFQKANKPKNYTSVLTTNFLSGIINLRGLSLNFVQVNLPGRLSRNLYRQTDEKEKALVILQHRIPNEYKESANMTVKKI